MDVVKTFEGGFFQVKSFEKKEEEEEWKLTVWKPAIQTCVRGNCIWNMADMVERRDKYNVIEIDFSSGTDITITFRAEKPTGTMKLTYTTHDEKERRAKAEQQQRWKERQEKANL